MSYRRDNYNWGYISRYTYIDDNFVLSNINGLYYVGGIVGSGNTSRIQRNYITGKITGNSYVGDIRGSGTVGTYANNFYTPRTTYQIVGTYGIEKTVYELATRDTYDSTLILVQYGQCKVVQLMHIYKDCQNQMV